MRKSFLYVLLAVLQILVFSCKEKLPPSDPAPTAVTLSAENDWEYRWDTLDVQSEWLVAEREIPVDYEVMIDYNQSQFLIRNTYHHSQETEVTTTPPAVTTATTATTPPPQITTTAPEKLVQTGQLWWPVLPLSLGGVVLIGAGISMRSGKKKDET